VWPKEKEVCVKLSLICFIVSFNAYAIFPTINVKNINGEYLDEKGHAYAEKASYKLPKVKIAHENIEVKFNKNQKNLIISDPSTTVELEFDFSFLNVFKAFSFTDVGIHSNEKLFSIDAPGLDLYINPKKYNITGFHIETDVSQIPTQDDEDITIVDGLMLNGTLSFLTLEFNDFDEIIFNDLKLENPQNISEIQKMRQSGRDLEIPMIVRTGKFTILNGVFNGSAKIDSYINLWLRLSGDVKSNKDNTEIDIQLTKAKLGIFSIKSTILNMVKRLNLDGVTVDGNLIHVNLKKTDKP